MRNSRNCMRELLEFAFERGRENNCPVILDTDDALKKAKYEHLGMKTVRTRKIADNSFMYDLVWKPDGSDGMEHGCFYIKGGCRRTDWFIKNLYQPKGFFTPPYETEQSLRKRLESMYSEVKVTAVEGIGCFCCRK